MFTRPHWVAVILFIGVVDSSQCQPPTTPVAQKDAMKKLDFLVGQWKGEGWMEFGGQKKTFKGTETVQSKLDGLLIAVEGLHYGKAGEDGKEVVVHNAFGVLSYDDKAKRYRFQAFTSRGGYEETEAKVSDKQLVWEMKIPNFGDVRYTTKLDEKGRWFEIGEVSKDGKEWQKFFEMTLEKVEPK